MILDKFRLDGKVALVTGAGRGLGRGMALALAEAGADVALLDRSGAPEVSEEVTALGRRVAQIKCDLGEASPADLSNVVDTVVAELGSLDILVNNAGIIRRTPALDHSQQDWDDVMRINLDAVFHLTQAAARVMAKAGGGSIVNIASMLSYQGGINVPSYTASKHAIVGLTRAFGNEWASRGITVNAIAPGYMATDNTAPLRADAERAASILARIPADRWGTPEDLQGTVVLLASPAGAYINGTTIPVDGGWLAR
jgi:2-deoxy-D-gluconate 3-dehydrogenase